MNETTKSKKLWGELEHSILRGRGLDIGSGPDPISPTARGFDLQDGDANNIDHYIREEFDYVFSSHCLEHMQDPHKAILGWWRLVRPGGHLFVIVPDEDLYEQGVFPSRFNHDHKATFSLSKAQSWSSVSINVLDLVSSLPNAVPIKVELQDVGYDRTLQTFGPRQEPTLPIRFVRWLYRKLVKPQTPGWLDKALLRYYAVDQTVCSDFRIAQILFIVRKDISN